MPEIIINGPEGRIEARYLQQREIDAPLAIILHPHPEHGGTMNNKIAYALFRCFTDRGFSAIRFNFRGVGRSEGIFDPEGEGELSDAATVLDWLQQQNLNPKGYWVAGVSFGAWIGMQLLMRRPELNGFISVSPPADVCDFSFLAPCPVSGLIVQGGQDETVPRESVDKLADKLSQQKGIFIDYQVIEGANHFYTQHMSELIAAVENHLTKANETFKLVG